MGFDDERLAAIEFLFAMAVKDREQPFHQLWNGLRVIVQLKCYYAEVVRRRIGHDVRKIAVERKENCTQFLSLRDHRWIERSNGKDFPQQSGLMTVATKCVSDFGRH